MARVKPLLDELELQHVQQIEIDDDQVLLEHEIPGLEGDFFQREDRRATRVKLNGIMTGDDVAEKLTALREKFRNAEPVPFVSDITTAVSVEQVLIAEMAVKEIAGKSQRFEYALALNEYIEPPPTNTETPDDPGDEPRPIIDPVEQREGTLVVEVIVEGEPAFDFSRIGVTVRGTQENGEALSLTIEERVNNIWTIEDIPVSQGEYLIEALESGDNPLVGSANTEVLAGQVAQVTITLRRVRSDIATTFLVHFRFDSAFVEPCMREVLKQVAQHAADNPSEKMLIVGHTDKAGSSAYNQALSERRARSVHGYLVFGRDEASAFADWNTLRQRRTGPSDTSVQDNWAAREYQQILQDLNFYPGKIDGDHGPATNDAVEAYRCHKGLPAGTQVDDLVWEHLIRDYLGQDNLAVPLDRFFPNCSDTDVIKWVGCGEEDPKSRQEAAFRPSRRTEILFVRATEIPCDIPAPVTLNANPPGDPLTQWCPDQTNAGPRCCFVTPFLDSEGEDVPTCPEDPNGRWCRMPEDPGHITVRGQIMRELPDGTLEPAANQPFVLIAADGTFKKLEHANGEPGEDLTGTGADAGTFEYPDLTKGFYSLEVRNANGSALLVRLEEAGDETVRGAQVCKAIRSDTDELNVVIINAPATREITIPVVGHVMTSLDPVSREVRTCTDGSNNTYEQRSELTDDEVLAAIEGANRIWRQARVRFELVDVVREAYGFTPDCDIEEPEIRTLVTQCFYENVINIFFVRFMTNRIGTTLSPQNAGPQENPGILMSDLRRNPTPAGTTVDEPIDPDFRAHVLAHELGHYLSLSHVDVTPANAGRLMLPGADNPGFDLVQDEIDQARSSETAEDDCIPLTLSVEGASQVGGTSSHQFIFVQHPEIVDPFEVEINAEIPESVLATGTLVMTGGNPGATPLQRTVPKTATGVFEIEVTFTPNGGDPVVERVVVTIATLSLRVEDATRLGGPDSSLFVSRFFLGGDITIIAELDPSPFCVPDSLVVWTNGIEHPDPLRRTVENDVIAETEVTATVAGESRSVTIRVFDVRLMSTFARIPVSQTLIRGIVNESLGNYNQAALIRHHRITLDQLLVLMPGLDDESIEVTLASSRADGSEIESISILARREDPTSFEYRTHPMAPLPFVIERSELTSAQPQDLEVVRSQAGGQWVINADEALAGTNSTEIGVSGRVLYIAAQAYQQGTVDAGVTEDDIRDSIALTNRIWAQAGFEIKERSIQVGVPDPGGLLELERLIDPGRSEDEQRLLGTHPDCAANPSTCATKSSVATDLNVYYVRDITDALAVAYEAERVVPIDGDGQLDSTLAHEIAHQFLDGWGCANTDDFFGEHRDPDCNEWPATNIMRSPASLPTLRRNIAIEQLENIYDHITDIEILVVEG